MYMFFNKINLMTILFFLSFSINIITAIYSDDEAGPSGFIAAASESNYEAGPSGPSSPFEELEETISADSDCWKNMQYYCKQKIPNAVDFAKAAIEESMMGDLFHKPHLDEYYILLLKFLKPGKILPPKAYCRMLERKKPLKNEIERTKCQITNEEALRYAFYQTKLNKIDSSTMFNIGKDFKSHYMKHIIHYVQVDEKMKTPLQFCIEYDKYKLNKEEFNRILEKNNNIKLK